jgi:hypothetical protein
MCPVREAVLATPFKRVECEVKPSPRLRTSTAAGTTHTNTITRNKRNSIVVLLSSVNGVAGIIPHAGDGLSQSTRAPTEAGIRRRTRRSETGPMIIHLSRLDEYNRRVAVQFQLAAGMMNHSSGVFQPGGRRRTR